MLIDTRPDECFLNFAEYIHSGIKDTTNQQAKELQKLFCKPEIMSDAKYTEIAELIQVQ